MLTGNRYLSSVLRNQILNAHIMIHSVPDGQNLIPSKKILTEYPVSLRNT